MTRQEQLEIRAMCLLTNEWPERPTNPRKGTPWYDAKNDKEYFYYGGLHGWLEVETNAA